MLAAIFCSQFIATTSAYIIVGAGVWPWDIQPILYPPSPAQPSPANNLIPRRRPEPAEATLLWVKLTRNLCFSLQQQYFIFRLFEVFYTKVEMPCQDCRAGPGIYCVLLQGTRDPDPAVLQCCMPPGPGRMCLRRTATPVNCVLAKIYVLVAENVCSICVARPPSCSGGAHTENFAKISK